MPMAPISGTVPITGRPVKTAAGSAIANHSARGKCASLCFLVMRAKADVSGLAGDSNV